MVILSKPEFAKSILLFSTGIYAVVGTTLNLAGVPAILASKNPVPGWKQLYNNAGIKLALPAIVISVVAGIWIYSAAENVGKRSSYLIISGLLGSMIPYTLIAMMPVNNQLSAISDESPVGENKETRELVKKWGNLQWVRTFVGLSAFLTNIYITYWD